MVNEDLVRQWFQDAIENKISAEEASGDNLRNIKDRCWFSQQCVEKLLKTAILAENTIEIPLIHDLDNLKNKLTGKWDVHKTGLYMLTEMEVSSRYSSTKTVINCPLTKQDADWAYSVAVDIYNGIEKGLKERNLL